ncbi:Uncharacterised protein [Bordetella pertussis]|nr:Uncharacterised protein [Bordetella pertussis]
MSSPGLRQDAGAATVFHELTAPAGATGRVHGAGVTSVCKFYIGCGAVAAP